METAKKRNGTEPTLITYNDTQIYLGFLIFIYKTK